MKAQGKYGLSRLLPVHVVNGQHTSASHVHLYMECRVHTGMHTGVCAQVHCWLLCRHVQAEARLVLGIACLPRPSAESAQG